MIMKKLLSMSLFNTSFHLLFYFCKRYRVNQTNSNEEDSLQERSVEGRDIRDDANKVTTGLRSEKL